MSDMPRPHQLTLLDNSAIPVALRLDAKTRRIGLEGIAHVRAILAEQARLRAERDAQTSAASATQLRHRRAA